MAEEHGASDDCVGPLPVAKAYYINLDARVDRREQMERELRKAGLARVTTRIAALTPQHSEVAAMVQEFPGKSAGYVRKLDFDLHPSSCPRLKKRAPYPSPLC